MGKGIENLISAKKKLDSSLEKSKSLRLSLESIGPRLDEINHTLLAIDVSTRPVDTHTDALRTVGAHINRAVVPAAAVLRVFDAIHGLEKSLSDPQSDLPGYLGVLKRLEEALRFLGENCGMAIQWLSDIAKCLEDHKVADGWFITHLNKALKNLQEVEAGDEKGHLDGGLLEVALNRLESEFRRLLAVNSVPLPMSTPISAGQDKPASIEASPLPVTVIQKLQAILGRLIRNNRFDKCVSIYVEVRSSNVQASLQALNLDYLKMSVSEFNSIKNTEVYLSQWGKHLEFAIKHLLEAEYRLCNDVFERTRSDVWKSCFAKIALQAGILMFFEFGKTVTESRKDPDKLLRLLDIFASLTRLRSNFNQLFGGDDCSKIQNLTRDLIKRVIEGSCAVFGELLVLVEKEIHVSPPIDCGIPRAVTFIIDYCNKLLGNNYKPILTQILAIERSWKHEKYQEKIFIADIGNLVKAVGLKLETWSKGYDNAVASHVFLMNNHCHLYKFSKGTKLGSLLGDAWLSRQEQLREYYSSMYLRESWGKLPGFLSREGLIMSGGRESARDRVKQALKAFNSTFDNMYKKQSNWIIPDKELRERTCQAIIQTVVPVFRSYVQSYGPLVEQETNEIKYVKYTAQSLEKMFRSLFLPKLVKQGSSQLRQPSVSFSNDFVDQHESSPTDE